MKLDTWPNLVAMFFDQAAKYGDKPFLWDKRDGTYVSTSWREAADEVAGDRQGLGDAIRTVPRATGWCCCPRTRRAGGSPISRSWPPAGCRSPPTSPTRRAITRIFSPIVAPPWRWSRRRRSRCLLLEAAKRCARAVPSHRHRGG